MTNQDKQNRLDSIHHAVVVLQKQQHKVEKQIEECSNLLLKQECIDVPWVHKQKDRAYQKLTSLFEQISNLHDDEEKINKIITMG
jgi:hypothetical protein